MSEIDLASQGMLGAYSATDGTIEFYGRVNAILRPDYVVVDLGAGRGGWFHDDPSPYRRSLRLIKGKVQQVIGLDVDAAVLDNPSTDLNLLIENDQLPLGNNSVDLLIADYVLEHLAHPEAIESEIYRVLRPGGTFCARTPHWMHYASIGARLIVNHRHASILTWLQPGRKSSDVFPTAYRVNSRRALRNTWTPTRWNDYSYLYTAQPMYYSGSWLLSAAMSFCHKVLPAQMVGNIFVFMVKNVPQETAAASRA